MAMSGVALITGAASGIGRETGLQFAEAGAIAVVFADINEGGAREAAEQSKKAATQNNYRAIGLHVDVRDASSVQAMVDKTVEEFGRIDYNVNSAGIGSRSRNMITEISLEEFDLLSSVNVRGALLCNKAVLKVMLKQEATELAGRSGPRSSGRGAIINVASVSAFVIGAGYAPYTTSKHAVIGMTKTAALENAPHGIRVNAVCPSWVDTPMLSGAINAAPQFRDWINKTVPTGRMAKAEEVAGVNVFLCSSAATYVNGIAMVVDGGLMLGGPGRP